MNDSPNEQMQSLLTQLRRLQGIDEIRTRVHHCARALDRLDAGLLRRQFWDDAQIDYGSIYRGSIAGFVDIAIAFQSRMRDTQHLVGNVTVTIDGDRAASESYVHAQHVIEEAGDLKQLVVGGRYLDRFERRNGEWRISYRTEVIDWGRMVPIAERWFEHSNELPKGLRSAEDLSYRYVG